MSESEKSLSYNKKILVGWLDGLRERHNTVLMEAQSDIKIQRKNGNDAGEIDALVKFRHGVRLRDLFPIVNIRPLSVQQNNPEVTYACVQIMGLLPTRGRVKRKVQQFVRLYTELLTQQTTLALPVSLKQAVEACSHLLFVFLEADLVRVETVMRKELTQMEIAGKAVVLVWADEVEVVNWGSMLRFERRQKEQDAKLAQLKAALAQREAKLAQLKAALAQGDAELARLQQLHAQLEAQPSKKRALETIGESAPPKK